MDDETRFDEATARRIEKAYAKLTPAQQRKANALAAEATAASKAYANARDQLFGPLSTQMDQAYKRYAKALGLPANFFIA